MNLDVAIIGGGPGGATTGVLLKKYAPSLSVGIFERERFPRDHIGESLLPPTSTIMMEMGVWDEVERSGFPIKLGATYTWGKTTEPWVFGFIPDSQLPAPITRPGIFDGWRRATAFQVDRSIYDDIMLRRAAELGAAVHQETRVAEVLRTGDRVDGLRLDSGRTITARYYIDASGNAAVLRKAMGVNVEVPTLLKNVAFWDYWSHPDWPHDGGETATRIHIRSLGFGWVWLIRIGAGRASVGLVCNAEYYRTCGQRPEELYARSLADNPYVSRLLQGATRRGKLDATNDWSYVVDRTYGENWFLVGEVAGFADPILSAGVTLTQSGARELAYSILELERGEHDRAWLLERYDDLQKRRVRQHMRFAEFWYSANGVFDAIRENCSRIAKESGLRLTAADAFRWLSFGGLTDDIPGQAGIGGLDLSGVKQVMARFTGDTARWLVDGKNVFKLNLAGAKASTVGYLSEGRIVRVPCWTRGERMLIAAGAQGRLIEALRASPDIEKILAYVNAGADRASAGHMTHVCVNLLEAMATDYWILCDVNRSKATLGVTTPYDGQIIYTDKTGTL
jgi:flavin-dependent dehydrogenase